MKRNLQNVTLLGIDCLDPSRLVDVSKICMKHFSFGSVKIMTSLQHNDDNIVSIQHLTYEEISWFLIKRLIDYVDTDYVLIIQYDGFILNPEAWTDEFLEFDYIGAPWFFKSHNVGTGGFSLRSRKLLKILSEDTRIDRFHPEDLIICRHYGEYLESLGIRFAPESIAARFCMEPQYNRRIRWQGEFGFHSFNTGLDDWPVLKYAHPVADADFIDRYKYYRNRRVTRMSKYLSDFAGVYRSKGDSQVTATISAKDGHLLFSQAESQILFFCVVFDIVFFCDEPEEMLMFRKFRSSGNLFFIRRAGNSNLVYERIADAAGDFEKNDARIRFDHPALTPLVRRYTLD